MPWCLDYRREKCEVRPKLRKKIQEHNSRARPIYYFRGQLDISLGTRAVITHRMLKYSSLLHLIICVSTLILSLINQSLILKEGRNEGACACLSR